MHGVVSPHSLAVEEAMRPIHDDILADEKDGHLGDERKRGERPVPVFIEGNQSVRRGDSEQQRRADDEQADAQNSAQ